MTNELELFQTVARWLAEGVPFAMATVVEAHGSAPRHAGARQLLRQGGETVGTVGGGAIERAVLDAAETVLRRGVARLLDYDLGPDLGMACGGKVRVFIEPMLAPDRLFIFGAGHVARALSPVASQLGFAVTVVDRRTEFASTERFPAATALIHSYDPAVWGELPLDAAAYCVVVTHGHEHDLELVRALMLREPAPRYIGMIGSRRKRRVVERALLEAGVPPGRLSEIHSPVGLDIGAETPAEIAVAIAAQLVQVRRETHEQTVPETLEEKTK